jgi:hypothetical protein
MLKPKPIQSGPSATSFSWAVHFHGELKLWHFRASVTRARLDKKPFLLLAPTISYVLLIWMAPTEFITLTWNSPETIQLNYTQSSNGGLHNNLQAQFQFCMYWSTSAPRSYFTRTSERGSIWVPWPDFFYFSDDCGFLDIEYLLWREDGSVIYLYNCFWDLPEQSLFGQSPAELTAILSHLRLPQPGGPGLEYLLERTKLQEEPEDEVLVSAQ